MSTDAATYYWDFGDGTHSTIANPTHTYATDGTYVVEEIVYNGCGENSISKNVVITTSSIDEEPSLINISIYPNPAINKTVTISFENNNNQVSINFYDVIGNLIDRIENIKTSSNVVKIDYNTDKLNSGVYFIEFNCNNGKVVKKLVVNN